MMSAPSPTLRVRRAYEHRLREHVVRSGARSLARHVPIPRSTVSTWQRRGLRPVVTIEPLDQDQHHLLESIGKLERRARTLAAVAAKADVLRAIESAQPCLPLTLILKVLRLEPARYHAGRHAGAVCALDLN